MTHNYSIFYHKMRRIFSNTNLIYVHIFETVVVIIKHESKMSQYYKSSTQVSKATTHENGTCTSLKSSKITLKFKRVNFKLEVPINHVKSIFVGHTNEYEYEYCLTILEEKKKKISTNFLKFDQ